MRRGMLQPHQAAVVQMYEDGRDRPALPFMTLQLGAPGAGIEMREQQLVHCVVDRVGFEQGVANLGKRGLRLEFHGSANFDRRSPGDGEMQHVRLSLTLL